MNSTTPVKQLAPEPFLHSDIMIEESTDACNLLAQDLSQYAGFNSSNVQVLHRYLEQLRSYQQKNKRKGIPIAHEVMLALNKQGELIHHILESTRLSEDAKLQIISFMPGFNYCYPYGQIINEINHILESLLDSTPVEWHAIEHTLNSVQQFNSNFSHTKKTARFKFAADFLYEIQSCNFDYYLQQMSDDDSKKQLAIIKKEIDQLALFTPKISHVFFLNQLIANQMVVDKKFYLDAKAHYQSIKLKNVAGDSLIHAGLTLITTSMRIFKQTPHLTPILLPMLTTSLALGLSMLTLGGTYKMMTAATNYTQSLFHQRPILVALQALANKAPVESTKSLPVKLEPSADSIIYTKSIQQMWKNNKAINPSNLINSFNNVIVALNDNINRDMILIFSNALQKFIEDSLERNDHLHQIKMLIDTVSEFLEKLRLLQYDASTMHKDLNNQQPTMSFILSSMTFILRADQNASLQHIKSLPPYLAGVIRAFEDNVESIKQMPNAQRVILSL